MKNILAAFAIIAAAASNAAGSGNWPLDETVLNNVLACQLDNGAWAKNIDKRKPFDEARRAKIMAAKSDAASATIDNNATVSEIRYLVRYFAHTKDERAREAACRGVEWLLSVQLDNGGWAQFPHRGKGYWTQITFNDNAMRNVLELMRDIAGGEGDFAMFDKSTRVRSSAAFDKGIECVLKCQIRVDGKPTVWCQQHDRVTLKPASGRKYELASYCSAESADLVLLLMSIENPSAEVKAAIEGAAAWFRANRMDNGEWARFYDLEECKPFYCDRSGVPKRNIEEIDPERRKGYSWFSSKPAQVLKKLDKPGKKRKK